MNKTNTPEINRVTKQDFWKAVESEKRNIHPHVEPFRTVWRLQDNLALWRLSTCGYKTPHGEVEDFFLVQEETK